LQPIISTIRNLYSTEIIEEPKIVTVYYFHDEPKTERYIAATIWEPVEVRGAR